MESGPGQCQDNHGGTALSQHESQLKPTGFPEGQIMSTKDYRQNVARDHARVHYGDQHHHYYARQSDTSDTEHKLKEFMQQLMKSLSFPQENSRFTTIEPAYQQTCQWLFETPAYARWRDWDLRRTHHGFLWLKGKPGTGKSTITKHALEHANATYLDERNIHFFFNARGDKLEKCTEGMYRSLLYQLAKDVPSLLQSVHVEAVKNYASIGWPLDLLRSLFREAVLKVASNVHLNCYIDALDEGEDEDQTREMVAFLEELAETAISKDIGLSVFFASRLYPNITIGRSENIVVDDYEGHRADIASYVSNKLSCRPQGLKDELVASIIARSSGIFLWVVLVVRILNTESDRGNQHRLKESLKSTPKRLGDLFSEIVSDEDADGPLLPTLLWVLFAKRSMSPLELYLAVVHCTNPDSSSPVVWNHATVDETSIINFITSSSRGLLQVVGTARRWYQTQEPPRGIVEFIHESVREYLLGPGLRRLDPTLVDNLVGVSNLRLAQWCQSYIELSLQHGPSTAAKEATLVHVETTLPLLGHLQRVAPFSGYALAAIIHHSEEAASRGLDVSVPFEDYLQSCLPLSLESMGFQRSEFANQLTTLHVLASEGCAHLVRINLQRYNQTVRQNHIDTRVKGGPWQHKVALHLAAQKRHHDVVLVLLQNGADVNACDHDGETLLHYALKRRFEFTCTQMNMMIQTALKYGADANARSKSGKIALDRLVNTGNLEAVIALLQYGADVNACDSEEWTPLMLGVAKRNLEMVKVLLAHTPDINAKNDSGRTSLNLASSEVIGLANPSPESRDIFDILLQHGADINVRGRNIEPLLSIVVRSKVHSVEDVRVFLKYGADVNASDSLSRTALHWAVERRDVGIIETLLQHNADVNAHNDWNATPLIQVASHRNTADTGVLQVLLENGANVNAVEWSNNTALHGAVISGNVEVTAMLLIYGADVHSRREGGPSIMDIAERKSKQIIIELLRYFADVPPHARLEAALALQPKRHEWCNGCMPVIHIAQGIARQSR